MREEEFPRDSRPTYVQASSSDWMSERVSDGDLETNYVVNQKTNFAGRDNDS